jgi:hypothetical protein
MNGIIYLTPKNLAGINEISELSNHEVFLRYLPTIDYHLMLFGTLYQNGARYIQLDLDMLPPHLKCHPFWKDKFMDIDRNLFAKTIKKADKILQVNFNHQLDGTFLSPQLPNMINYFSALFYSSESGIPFINPEYSEFKDFAFLESRFSKELFVSLKNLTSLMQFDSMSSLIPRYSVLNTDIRRFEDIAMSTTYKAYSTSVELLSNASNLEDAKKEVHFNAIKVYNKYANYIDIKSVGFSFIKYSKKLADIFISKPFSIAGDYFIDLLEKTTTGKRKVFFYKADNAHYMILWGNRFGQLMSLAGKDVLDSFLTDIKQKRNNLPPLSSPPTTST